MKYGEIFELTGKGKIAALAGKTWAASRKVAMQDPSKRAEDELRYVKLRDSQAYHLHLVHTYDHGANDRKDLIDMARTERFRSKMVGLDPSKPDDWMKVKKLKNNMGWDKMKFKDVVENTQPAKHEPPQQHLAQRHVLALKLIKRKMDRAYAKTHNPNDPSYVAAAKEHDEYIIKNKIRTLD